VAIAGPSGSGKTTLLNLAAGLDTPTSRRAHLTGNDLSRMSLRQKAQLRLEEVGFIFQAYNLGPVLSAQENAEFTLLLQRLPAAERERQVKEDPQEQVGLKARRPGELSGAGSARIVSEWIRQASLSLARSPHSQSWFNIHFFQPAATGRAEAGSRWHRPRK